MVDKPMTADAEAVARAVNAEPWEPLPGMAKRRCLRCRYLFAVMAEEAETTATCPDCAPLLTRARANRSARYSQVRRRITSIGDIARVAELAKFADCWMTSRFAFAFLQEARLCGAGERLPIFVDRLWLTGILRASRTVRGVEI